MQTIATLFTRFSLLLAILAVSTGAVANDQQAVRTCLANWGKHPFDARNPEFRVIQTKVSVFGVGRSTDDTVVTQKPDLVLIKPNVSVMTSTVLNLENPNGWYCLQRKVNVMAKSVINLNCKAHLASTSEGLTVLGDNNDEKDITVLGKTVIKRDCGE